MRTLFAVAAVAITVLLGIIAVELYPIAALSYGVLHLGDNVPVTAEQRRERAKHLIDEADADADAFIGALNQKQSRSKRPLPAPSKAPASR